MATAFFARGRLHYTGSWRRPAASHRRVQPLGGGVYYVGGCVRDRLLGRESKDLDIEVHGVTPQQLEIVLDRMGGRRTVGASFGVYGLAGCGLTSPCPGGRPPWAGATGLHRGGGSVAGAGESRPPPGFHRQRPDGGRAHRSGAGLLRRPGGPPPGPPYAMWMTTPFQRIPCGCGGAQFAARFGFTVAEETVALCRTNGSVGPVP